MVANQKFPLRGEVWKVRFLNHPKDKKVRPAVIISVDDRNELASDVLCIPLSTHLRKLVTHVFLPKGAGGIDYDSMAKCEQIAAIDKDQLIDGPLGPPLDETTLNQLVKAVVEAMAN